MSEDRRPGEAVDALFAATFDQANELGIGRFH
jgi:hypothetical protein